MRNNNNSKYKTMSVVVEYRVPGNHAVNSRIIEVEHKCIETPTRYQTRLQETKKDLDRLFPGRTEYNTNRV